MLKKVRKSLFYFTEVLSALSLFVMLVVVSYQVVARYIPFMNIPSWTEELARFLLIYIIAFAGGLAVEKKAFVGMDSFYMLLPLRLQKSFDIIFNIVTGYLFYIIFYYGFSLMQKAHIQLSPAMQISMSYVYISLPLLGIGMLFFLLLDSITALQSIIKNQEIKISSPDEHIIYFVSEEEKIEELKKEKTKKRGV